MRIISFIPETFQEYEDQISLVLFCLGCNLKCVYCYNYEEISNPDKIIGTALEVLEKQINPLHTAVVFLGGEPTIWGDTLLEALRYVKEKDLLTKIFTNGMNTKVIQSAIDAKLVDAFSVDFKVLHDAPDVLGRTISTDEYLAHVDESIQAIIAAGLPLEIRTTIWNSFDGEEEIKAYISERYPGIPHIIQQDFREKIKT